MSNSRKAIVHIDGDAFFASCEIAQNEALRGKPVVVGRERGIATAVSYEAKARGVTRGMLMGEIKRICPDVIIAASHYEIYRIYSRRMYEIVRRYTPYVEEYSVDECFADVSHLCSTMSLFEAQKRLQDLAADIQRSLEKDLGMTFSIGLAQTKVLAKIASKWSKPAGRTVIMEPDILAFLEGMPIGKVWGIGPSTSLELSKVGIKHSLDFALKPEWWIKENLSKPYHEIWHELNGRPVLPVNTSLHHDYKSIMKTRSFAPTKNHDYIFSELCKNIESACARLRRYDLKARYARFFIKTQQFRYYSAELLFDTPVNTPLEVIREAQKQFGTLVRPNADYRATGITFAGLFPAPALQHDLFGSVIDQETSEKIFETVDTITNRHGSGTVYLAKSFAARKKERRDEKKEGEYDFLKLGIPCWGDAH